MCRMVTDYSRRKFDAVAESNSLHVFPWSLYLAHIQDKVEETPAGGIDGDIPIYATVEIRGLRTHLLSDGHPDRRFESRRLELDFEKVEGSGSAGDDACTESCSDMILRKLKA